MRKIPDRDILKDWLTKAGLRAVVMANRSVGHRCGYVAVGAMHPLYRVAYSASLPPCYSALWEQIKTGKVGKRGIIPLVCSVQRDTPSLDVVFDVHGSLTYSGGNDGYPVPHDKLWWFGFDAGHCDDARDLDMIDNEQVRRVFARLGDLGGTIRSTEYMAEECERLAEQLAAFTMWSEAAKS